MRKLRQIVEGKRWQAWRKAGYQTKQSADELAAGYGGFASAMLGGHLAALSPSLGVKMMAAGVAGMGYNMAKHTGRRYLQYRRNLKSNGKKPV